MADLFDIVVARKLSGGGGGGGSSDFSTAEVTLTSTGANGDVYMPLIQEGGNGFPDVAFVGAFFKSGTPQKYNVILYKGSAGGVLAQPSVYQINNISGDAQNVGNGVFLITGNCSIDFKLING